MFRHRCARGVQHIDATIVVPQIVEAGVECIAAGWRAGGDGQRDAVAYGFAGKPCPDRIGPLLRGRVMLRDDAGLRVVELQEANQLAVCRTDGFVVERDGERLTGADAIAAWFQVVTAETGKFA